VPPPATPNFFLATTSHDRRVADASEDTPKALADERFSWDTHFGGSFDLLDLVWPRRCDGRLPGGGGQRIPPVRSQPGQLHSRSVRDGRAGGGEIGAIFHHVSRHLSDRPKRDAIAWNELGARLLRRISVGPTLVDLDVEGGRAIQHSFVDYTWLGEVNVLVRHPINERSASSGAPADSSSPSTRNWRAGRPDGRAGRGGVRLIGRAAIMEIFAGYENRVDAYPLDREPQHWGLTGLRLLSR